MSGPFGGPQHWVGSQTSDMMNGGRSAPLPFPGQPGIHATHDDLMKVSPLPSAILITPRTCIEPSSIAVASPWAAALSSWLSPSLLPPSSSTASSPSANYLCIPLLSEADTSSMILSIPHSQSLIALFPRQTSPSLLRLQALISTLANHQLASFSYQLPEPLKRRSVQWQARENLIDAERKFKAAAAIHAVYNSGVSDGHSGLIMQPGNGSYGHSLAPPSPHAHSKRLSGHLLLDGSYDQSLHAAAYSGSTSGMPAGSMCSLFASLRLFSPPDLLQQSMHDG
jgi:hypothetical protein